MLKRYALLIIISFSFLFSMPKDYWLHNEKVVLKKDKFYTAWVYRDKDSKKEYKKILYFRWTLFHNNILTMHLNLEKFNHQFVLKEDMFQHSFKLDIFDSSYGIENPFLLIMFDSFDVKKKEVHFTFLIRDEFGSIEIEKIEEKR